MRDRVLGLRSCPDGSVEVSMETGQAHGFSHMVTLSQNASLMGSLQPKRVNHSTLIPLIMGEISLIFNNNF